MRLQRYAKFRYLQAFYEYFLELFYINSDNKPFKIQEK
nr:MAG TPA: hypothetical protein [Caudoviricetes sp.]